MLQRRLSAATRHGLTATHTSARWKHKWLHLQGQQTQLESVLVILATWAAQNCGRIEELWTKLPWYQLKLYISLKTYHDQHPVLRFLRNTSDHTFSLSLGLSTNNAQRYTTTTTQKHYTWQFWVVWSRWSSLTSHTSWAVAQQARKPRHAPKGLLHDRCQSFFNSQNLLAHKCYMT